MVVEALTAKVRAIQQREQEKKESATRRKAHRKMRGRRAGEPQVTD